MKDLYRLKFNIILILLIILLYKASDDVQMPDSLGHSVGAERYELLAHEAGEEVSKFRLSFQIFKILQ